MEIPFEKCCTCDCPVAPEPDVCGDCYPITDAMRLDWLQQMMTPKDNYCEIYLAGLRNGPFDAKAFQVESSPEKFHVVDAPTLRLAIDEAMFGQRTGKLPNDYAELEQFTETLAQLCQKAKKKYHGESAKLLQFRVLLEESMQFCQRKDCDGDPLNIALARKIHEALQV